MPDEAEALTTKQYPELLFYDWNTQYSGGIMAGIEDGVIEPISEIPEYKEKVPNFRSLPVCDHRQQVY